MDIDVYQQYFAAEGCFSGVQRRGVSVMLTSSSGGGEIRYTLTVTFFPYEDAEDFRISYDAVFSKVRYEGRGRRSKSGSRLCWKRCVNRRMRFPQRSRQRFSGKSRCGT